MNSKSLNYKIKMIVEAGVSLSLIVMFNVIASIFVTRIFPEGWTINFGFIFVVIFFFRHNLLLAATLNFIASWLTSFIVTPGTFFPPVAVFSGWGIVISLLFDYIGASFIAIIIAGLITKKTTQVWIKILIITSAFFTLSFAFTFLSGILVWGNYATSSKWGVYLYSFIYNFTSATISLVFSLIVLTTIQQTLPTFFQQQSLESHVF